MSDKTTVILDTKDLSEIEGNRSQFIREAVGDKLLSKISVDVKVNERKMKELKLKLKSLKLEIEKVDGYIKNLKDWMKD